MQNINGQRRKKTILKRNLYKASQRIPVCFWGASSMTAFSTIRLSRPLFFNPCTVYTIFHKKCLQVGVCGKNIPAYLIMSCETPRAWALRQSTRGPTQRAFQCRSPRQAHTSHSCCAVHGEDAAPQAGHTCPPCWVSNLCLKPGTPAWEMDHAASQQTCKTDTWWHGVWDKADGDKVPWTWQVCSVYRGCRLHFLTLSKIICIFIYIKQMLLLLVKETTCEWVPIKSSPHHLFFNPINYLQVCNTEIICSTKPQDSKE